MTRLSRPPFAILGVWLGCDDRQVHLILNESGTYRATTSPDIADAHFAFRTDNFEGMVERLKAAGFSDDLPENDRKRIVIIREGLAGFPQLHLLDPDLNTIEVNAAPMKKSISAELRSQQPLSPATYQFVHNVAKGSSF